MEPDSHLDRIREPQPDPENLEAALFCGHPNLAEQINRNIAQAEIEGGARLDRIPAGTMLEVETQHRYYTIEYRGGSLAIICGHPRFCPRPTLVRISGSTWGGSMLWASFIGRGMHLEFAHPVYGRITTSRITDVRVLDENHPPSSRTRKAPLQPELN